MLRRCVLYIPKDLEESTADEDIRIILKPLIEVNFHRELVGSHYKVPLTFTLLGFKTEMIGVKVAVYNRNQILENGIFFIVNSQEWEFSEEERKLVPKKKDYQKDDLMDFSWLPEKLKKKGYKIIRSAIKIEQEPNDNQRIDRKSVV